MDLEHQKENIELNFKNVIKRLKNGSDDNVYGFIIPMFNDIQEKQFYVERKPLIEVIEEAYSIEVIKTKVLYECEFIEIYKEALKTKNTRKIFKFQIMSFLYGFLDTAIMFRHKDQVEKEDIEMKKQKKKNKKKREQKKRNKWKKPPSPSLDYKTYDWNIPDIQPPSYVPPLPLLRGLPHNL